MSTSIISLDDTVRGFAEAFTRAEDSFRTAGKIYADAVAQYGQEAREKFAAACPKIAPTTWRRLEALGNGSLDGRLLTAASIGAAALRRLPSTAQSAALDNGVEVLIGNGETLRIQVDNLTPEQSRQVFASDHIRDIPAQRAWLETHAPQTARPALVEAPAWKVTGGKVQVARACSLTRLDLARMLAEMG